MNENNNKIIELMNEAMNEAIGLINKAVIEILSDFKDKSIKTLSLAQSKLDMESEDKFNNKQFKENDKVWCLISGQGFIAGNVKSISYNNDYIINLIAGPDKFSQQVYVKESQLKIREE